MILIIFIISVAFFSYLGTKVSCLSILRPKLPFCRNLCENNKDCPNGKFINTQSKLFIPFDISKVDLNLGKNIWIETSYGTILLLSQDGQFWKSTFEILHFWNDWNTASLYKWKKYNFSYDILIFTKLDCREYWTYFGNNSKEF